MDTRGCYLTGTDACGLQDSCVPDSCLMRPVGSEIVAAYIHYQLDILEQEKAAEIAARPKPRLDYDDIMGRAWIIEDREGRYAANQFLLVNGLRAIPEDDGK